MTLTISHGWGLLRHETGQAAPLHVARWHEPADAVDRSVLRRCLPPVLDIGCGPGRLAAALADQGVPVMGVEPSPTAVTEARSRGVAVLARSVFAPLPGEGRWGSVLLFDGNVGIGGNPRALLERCAELLRKGGLVLADLGAPGELTSCFTARIERDDEQTPWFPWATVGVDTAETLGDATGFDVADLWEEGDRWFVAWRRRPS